MKILMLSPVHPCPPNRGSKIRVYHSVDRLRRQNTIHGLSFSDADSSQSGVPEHDGEQNPVCETIESKGNPKGTFASAAHSVLDNTTYRGAKFDGSGFRDRLREVVTAEDFDLLWVHFLNMLRFFQESDLWDAVRDVPIVLDQHNDVERVWQRNRQQGGIAEQLFARWNIDQIRDLRSWTLPRCDVILSVSEEDAETTRTQVENTPVWVAPNGVDLDRFSSDSGTVSMSPRLLFVGSMDVKMNIDAITWFAREIYPQIRAHIPDAEFQVVGRNPASEVRALDQQEGIDVTGGVERVRPYYERAGVAVVPLRRGGGTKLKVPEAMAARVPVVATSVGAQGLNIEDGVHLRIADEAGLFAEAVTELMVDREEAQQLVRAAYDRVEQQYSWTGIYDGVMERIEAEVIQAKSVQ